VDLPASKRSDLVDVVRIEFAPAAQSSRGIVHP
jgi:hypothetical protein